MDSRTFVAMAGSPLLELSPGLRSQSLVTPRRIGENGTWSGER